MSTKPSVQAAPGFERSVIVVEDDGFVRSLLADTLEAQGFIVSTASSAADAKRLIIAIDPDAVVLDIDLGPGPNGFDIADMLRARSAETAILFLTSMPDPRFAGRDDKAVYKNAAYLNKHLLENTSTLIDALEAVLTERGVSKYRHHELSDRPLAQLSRTQIQVLQLLAQGKTNQQIADIRKRSLAATSSAVTRTLEAIGVDADAEINVRVTAAMAYAAHVQIPPLNLA
jgi:DNA-binding NarL/FixJ family response regulator